MLASKFFLMNFFDLVTEFEIIVWNYLSNYLLYSGVIYHISAASIL